MGKKPSPKWDALVNSTTPEEVRKYYIEENHTKEEAKAYFKTTERVFRRYLEEYNIKKPVKLVWDNAHKTCEEKYGDPYYCNREAAHKTCMEKYGAETPLASKEIWDKTHKTLLATGITCGCQNMTLEDQLKACRKGGQGMHKLMKEDEDFRKQVNQAMYDTKKKNGTFNTSQPEEEMYAVLCEQYGKNDIEREYNSDPRYPFKCDFYIKSLDQFIELNLHPSHGTHPFDSDNKDDCECREKLENTDTKWAKMILSVWCDRDVKKLEYAKASNLHYKTIYKDEVYTYG